jgi:hypothetical protein
MKYKTPKYPRVMVSPERHAKLAKEAAEKKISIAEVSEKKFVKAK